MSGPWSLADGPGVLRLYRTSQPGTGASRSGFVLCHDLPTGRGSARDAGRSYPALADRLAQECGHPAAWFAELAAIRPMEAAAKLAGRPLLVVEGTPAGTATAGARSLAEAGGPKAELRIINGAGRRLRADPRAVATLIGWLERQS